MISILISTYNYDCYRLVRDLHKQCTSLGEPFEIIVGDDNSRDQQSVISNRKVTELENTYYLTSTKNLGPAANRNRMAEKSKGDWLIFIDCDAKVCSDDFVKSYAECRGKGADVIVGGIQTPHMDKSELCAVCETADLGQLHSHFIVNRTLRYKYERHADGTIRQLTYRKQHPYQHFSTFNFMIRRSVFMLIRFNKNCTSYGFEDTLFGRELQLKNISIMHIDNPLLHMGIDTNEAFIRKTENALQVLVSIGDDILQNSHVGKLMCTIERMHLKWGIKLGFKLVKALLRKNLLGLHPNLKLFALYKLGYICNINRE